MKGVPYGILADERLGLFSESTYNADFSLFLLLFLVCNGC